MLSMSDNCIFCSIIAKKIPATVIAENDAVVVIKDIAPKAPIHYLVIPKMHVADFMDVQAPALSQSLIEMVQQVARQLPGNQAFRLLVNNGAGVGQAVFHLHIHLLAGKAMSDF
jgi:histidine triad (HIT) family protein